MLKLHACACVTYCTHNTDYILYLRTHPAHVRNCTHSVQLYFSIALKIMCSLHPYIHTQTGPTDLRHFDPTLTNLPPTITDLITTDRALHLEDFDYVAPAPTNTAEYVGEKKNGETPNEGTVPAVGNGSSSRNGELDSSNEETGVLTQLVSVEVNDF